MRRELAINQDAGAVQAFLERGSHRLQLQQALRAALWGPFLLFVLPRQIRRARREAATAIERRDGRFKNVLITADEILAGRLGVTDYVATRVTSDAAAVSARVDLRTVIPLKRAAVIAATSIVIWGLLVVLLLRWAGSTSSVDSVRQEQASHPQTVAWHVNVTIVPPAYSGQQTVTLVDPDRVEALEGSALHLRVEGAAALRARTSTSTRVFTPRDDSIQTAVVTLNESGYVAVEPADATTGGTMTRLIAVTVVPDRAPVPVVTVPGKDLLLPDVNRSVGVAGSAADDIGLTRLELRFTTISGSGEQFDFKEGAAAIAIERDSAVRWRASGNLPLRSLGLEPGDTVIYRFVAFDGRGTAGASDTYMVEIAAPGHPTLAGFELPPDRDRYAISQQMILLKVERLHARRASLTAEALTEEAQSIAAEQRTVRATFTFLMGGEVQDEEEEAAHAHEIEEGRLENAARRDMLEAVRHMTIVETRLMTPDTGGAIPPARAAVQALERAFGRRRYFLRTLPVRSRIDPSRRLSGKLDEAHDSSRSADSGEEPPQASAARRASADLVALTAQFAQPSTIPATDAARLLSRAAERVLALDPSSGDLQAAALRLARRAAAVSAGARIEPSADDLLAALDVVLTRAQRFAPRPLEPQPPDATLKGRWLAAIEEGGRR
jgi:hypothetical protein